MTLNQRGNNRGLLFRLLATQHGCIPFDKGRIVPGPRAPITKVQIKRTTRTHDKRQRHKPLIRI